jgi:hypothetical protein
VANAVNAGQQDQFDSDHDTNKSREDSGQLCSDLACRQVCLLRVILDM